MRLFGTRTSPFVRRVRIVAMEHGVPFDLVDTSTPEGAQALARVTPIAKVPAAEIDGRVVFDSRTLVDEVTARSPGPLAPWPRDRAALSAALDVVNVIDEATLALIRLFYARRDGVGEGLPVLAKERARANACLRWLEDRAHGASFDGSGRFGRAELAWVTSAGWMRFRDVVALSPYPRLAAVEAAWSQRPAVIATAPGR